MILCNQKVCSYRTRNNFTFRQQVCVTWTLNLIWVIPQKSYRSTKTSGPLTSCLWSTAIFYILLEASAQLKSAVIWNHSRVRRCYTCRDKLCNFSIKSLAHFSFFHFLFTVLVPSHWGHLYLMPCHIFILLLHKCFILLIQYLQWVIIIFSPILFFSTLLHLAPFKL